MDPQTGYLDIDRSRAHVLLVEDDRSLAGLLGSFLQEQGYPVTCTYDAPEALALLRLKLDRDRLLQSECGVATPDPHPLPHDG